MANEDDFSCQTQLNDDSILFQRKQAWSRLKAIKDKLMENDILPKIFELGLLCLTSQCEDGKIPLDLFSEGWMKGIMKLGIKSLFQENEISKIWLIIDLFVEEGVDNIDNKDFDLLPSDEEIDNMCHTISEEWKKTLQMNMKSLCLYANTMNKFIFDQLLKEGVDIIGNKGSDSLPSNDDNDQLCHTDSDALKQTFNDPLCIPKKFFNKKDTEATNKAIKSNQIKSYEQSNRCAEIAFPPERQADPEADALPKELNECACPKRQIIICIPKPFPTISNTDLKDTNFQVEDPDSSPVIMNAKEAVEFLNQIKPDDVLVFYLDDNMRYATSKEVCKHLTKNVLYKQISYPYYGKTRNSSILCNSIVLLCQLPQENYESNYNEMNYTEKHEEAKRKSNQESDQGDEYLKNFSNESNIMRGQNERTECTETISCESQLSDTLTDGSKHRECFNAPLQPSKSINSITDHKDRNDLQTGFTQLKKDTRRQSSTKPRKYYVAVTTHRDVRKYFEDALHQCKTNGLLFHGPHILWPNGHPLLPYKIRYIQHSNYSNSYMERLHSFLLNKNREGKRWPDDSTVSTEPLVTAGFSYDGNGDEVVCRSCGFTTHTDEWSDDDEQYAMSVHRNSGIPCPFLESITAMAGNQSTTISNALDGAVYKIGNAHISEKGNNSRLDNESSFALSTKQMSEEMHSDDQTTKVSTTDKTENACKLFIDNCFDPISQSRDEGLYEHNRLISESGLTFTKTNNVFWSLTQQNVVVNSCIKGNAHIYSPIDGSRNIYAISLEKAQTNLPKNCKIPTEKTASACASRQNFLSEQISSNQSYSTFYTTKKAEYMRTRTSNFTSTPAHRIGTFTIPPKVTCMSSSRGNTFIPEESNSYNNQHDCYKIIMISEVARIRSYDMEVDTMRIKSNLALARSGFYNTDMFGISRCFCCGLGLCDFDMLDEIDIFVIHIRHMPHCHFLVSKRLAAVLLLMGKPVKGDQHYDRTRDM